MLFRSEKSHLLGFEEISFTANLLVPKTMLLEEMAKIDTRRNILSELATMFWVPKSLVGFQLQDIIRSGQKMPVALDEGRTRKGPNIQDTEQDLPRV